MDLELLTTVYKNNFAQSFELILMSSSKDKNNNKK